MPINLIYSMMLCLIYLNSMLHDSMHFNLVFSSLHCCMTIRLVYIRLLNLTQSYFVPINLDDSILQDSMLIYLLHTMLLDFMQINLICTVLPCFMLIEAVHSIMNRQADQRPMNAEPMKRCSKPLKISIWMIPSLIRSANESLCVDQKLNATRSH